MTYCAFINLQRVQNFRAHTMSFAQQTKQDMFYTDNRRTSRACFLMREMQHAHSPFRPRNRTSQHSHCTILPLSNLPIADKPLLISLSGQVSNVHHKSCCVHHIRAQYAQPMMAHSIHLRSPIAPISPASLVSSVFHVLPISQARTRADS